MAAGDVDFFQAELGETAAITYTTGGSGSSISAIKLNESSDWEQDDKGKDIRDLAVWFVKKTDVTAVIAGSDTITEGSDIWLVNGYNSCGGFWRLECSRTVRQTRGYEGLRDR